MIPAPGSVVVEYLSDSTEDDLRPFLGRTIARMESREYVMGLTFTDGSKMTITGNRWDGCALGVECEPADASNPVGSAREGRCA